MGRGEMSRSVSSYDSNSSESVSGSDNTTNSSITNLFSSDGNLVNIDCLSKWLIDGSWAG